MCRISARQRTTFTGILIAFMADRSGQGARSLSAIAMAVASGLLCASACSQILTADDLMGGSQDAGSHDTGDGGDALDEPDAKVDVGDAGGEAGASSDASDASESGLDADASEDAEAGHDAEAAVEEPSPCTAETEDCDGDVANGCETEVMSDPLHCGACDHDCLGGECVGGHCQPVVLATGQQLPTGVAVAPGAQGRVYWTNRTDDGTVSSVSKQGGAVMVHATDQPRPGAIVISFGQIYWTCAGLQPSTGLIATIEAGSDGGGATVLASEQNNPFALATFGGKLYWTNSLDNVGTVMTVDTEGQGLQELASNQDLPVGIAADEVAVYWANLNDHEIRFWELNAGLGGLFLGGLTSPGGVAVDVINVYWTEITGDVHGATKVGKHITTYATGQSTPTGVAVDGLHLYWANNGGGTINRALKASAPSDAGAQGLTELASGQNGPMVVALDNTAIYWCNAGDGTIMRLAK